LCSKKHPYQRYQKNRTLSQFSLEKTRGTIVVPEQAIPGVGWNACVKNTEGNIFGITQGNSAA
jgi:predicted enzyme related to lactoylglutathione lyase